MSTTARQRHAIAMRARRSRHQPLPPEAARRPPRRLPGEIDRLGAQLRQEIIDTARRTATDAIRRDEEIHELAGLYAQRSSATTQWAELPCSEAMPNVRARRARRHRSSDGAYLGSVHRDTVWQTSAWAGFVCVLLAANGLAHQSSDQALTFFGGAIFLFLWAAWLASARH